MDSIKSITQPNIHASQESIDPCDDITGTKKNTNAGTLLTYRTAKSVEEPRRHHANKALTLDELNNLNDADFIIYIKNLIDNNQAKILDNIPPHCFTEGKETVRGDSGFSNREGRFRYGDFSYPDRRSTLLHYAIDKDKTDCLQVIATKLPSLLNKLNKQCLMPIHCAAIKGNTASIKILHEIDEKQIFKYDECDSLTPLFYSISEGHLECTGYIIEKLIEQRQKTFTSANDIRFATDHQDLQCFYGLAECKKNTLEILQVCINKIPRLFKDKFDVRMLLTSLAESHKEKCILELMKLKDIQEMMHDIDISAHFRKAIYRYPDLFRKVLKDRLLPRKPIPGFNLDTYKSHYHHLALTDLKHEHSVSLHNFNSGYSTADKLGLTKESSVSNNLLHAAKAFLATVNQVGVHLNIVTRNNDSQGKHWSFGDATASIQIMDTLIDLGVKNILLFVTLLNNSNSLPECTAMHQLQILLSETNPLTTGKKISRRGSSVEIIVLGSQTKKITLPSVNMGFNASEVQLNDFEKLGQPDNSSFISVKPYCFAKFSEYLLTDINNKEDIKKANSIYLNLPTHSILTLTPEVTTKSKRSPPDNHFHLHPFSPDAARRLHKVYDSSVDIRNNTEMPDISSLSIPEENTGEANCSEQSTKLPDNLSEAITLPDPAVDKLCNMRANGQIHISVVYGLHHCKVSSNALHSWIEIIQNHLNTGQSDNNYPVIIAVFPNTDKSTIETLANISKSKSRPVIDMGEAKAIEELGQLKNGQVVIAKMPNLRKSIFNKLVSCSDYPTLAEGANLTSYLLETGHPYLSLLPDGKTAVPQDIGDPFEAMKTQALSYKLKIMSYSRERRKLLIRKVDNPAPLKNLNQLIQSEKYEDAAMLIDNFRKEDPKCELNFLWGELNTNQPPQSKAPITIEWLVKKAQKLQKEGKKLGKRGIEALNAAVDPSLQSHVSYLNSCLDQDSDTVHHARLMQSHINQPVNSAVIFAIVKFLQHKGIPCDFP